MTQTVHVLLATFNGERHLAQQWRSLQAQTGVRLVVHVADDGSTDGTAALLEQLAASRAGAVTQVHWLNAPPRRSATRSFLLLLEQVLRDFPDAAYLAYCDQDDVWLSGKLEAALAALASAPRGTPALYGGRTLIVDEQDRELGLSPLFARPYGFGNALCQSIMGGNTMVMNRPAAQLVLAAGVPDVPAHDWFTAQAVTGAGGQVHYDARPFVRYRQHAANVVGSNRGPRALWQRLRRAGRGDFKSWNGRNVAALAAIQDQLAPHNRLALEAFSQARLARGPASRLGLLRRSGARRQPFLQHCALWLACAMGRI